MLDSKRFLGTVVVSLMLLAAVMPMYAADMGGGGFGGGFGGGAGGGMGGGFGGGAGGGRGGAGGGMGGGMMGGGFGGGAGGGFDRTAMQERMMTQLQEELGISDDEWKIIQPRLQKVMDLQQAANAGGRGGMMGMMMGGGRGGRGGRGNRGGAAAEDQTPVQKASAALEETLAKDAPSSAEIKTKLTALRGAREKAKADLAEAQAKLKEVLSVKQEAQLVMMGYLE